MMESETSQVRDILAPFCKGDGLDIGYGGDPIIPTAICMDLPRPYTKVGEHPQHLHGDCRSLPFKDGTLGFVYSSHLIEDFSYDEQVEILKEWIRVLRGNGRLVICAPDQQRYVEYCRAQGEEPNQGHKEADYSWDTFERMVFPRLERVREHRLWSVLGKYSWAVVMAKV